MKSPDKPRPINHYEWDEDYTEQIIMNCDLLTDENASFEDHLEDWKDENDWQPGQPVPTIDLCGYQNDICTLAELLAKIPTDVAPDNIILTVNRDRDFRYINFAVSVKRPVDEEQRQKLHEAAIAEHEVLEKKYQEELAVYEKWKKEQDIKALEDKLAVLKNDSNP